MNPRSRLRGSFAEVLQKQVGELAQLAREALADVDVLDALVADLERIRGTAQSLGLDAVDRAAQVVVAACTEGGNLIDAVEQLVDACRSIEGLSQVFRPLVLLVDDPPPTDDYAAVIRTTASVEGALELARDEDPSAFVVHYDHIQDFLARLDTRSRTVPLYVVGPAHDLLKRVDAYQLGAVGYLSEPVNLGGLLQLVRTRPGEADPAPFRVLLVEPDAKLAPKLIETIRSPDRVVRHVSRAAEALPVLDAFQPELVVLATDLGEVRGIDLAAVIRSHEAMADVPVLFLASQEDVEITGFMAAGDDVLIKPVATPTLRSRVGARLARYRRSQRRSETDRLTGVLSRSSFLRAADREVGLARRSGSPLAVVLIDIDGMAALNVRHGFELGDAVLRRLAEGLGRSLRETDAVGRVGGDAFGLLMPRCAAPDARRRVEGARREFLDWAAREGFDQVDFSAGIADTTPGFRDVLARADNALLEARHAGGGRSQLHR